MKKFNKGIWSFNYYETENVLDAYCMGVHTHHVTGVTNEKLDYAVNTITSTKAIII